MKKSLFTLTWLGATAISTSLFGQTTYEDGPDGVRYQVTRSQRSIPSTEYQAREQKFYTPQVTTEYQTYAQTYLTPVTEYRWQPHLRNWWNPFSEPYWTHEVRPVTRWEARPGTVQVPVARTNWVEGSRTTQVPVTTYHTVQDEYRVAVGVTRGGSSIAPSGSTSVANRSPIGGQQLQSDPPKAPSQWAPPPSGDGYRR